MHVINYAHLINNNLYHGTISDLDGSVKATWSYEEGNKKITRDQPITEEEFFFLWNSIAELDIFHQHILQDPEQEIDWVSYHFIGIVFITSEQQGQHTLMIPKNETDPEFIHWLEILNVPKASTP